MAFFVGKIANVDYWAISNTSYDKNSWIWRKIKTKSNGLTFLAPNTKANQKAIQDILFKLRLQSSEETYIERLYVSESEIERSIWFANDADFTIASNSLKEISNG